MEIITQNPRMQALLQQARQMARSDHPILIQGESGTGKERLAWYIHRASHRASAPFIKLDCTAVPERQWDAELLGTDSRPGKFDLARGGTLFLDQVCDLPLPIQGRLLSLLQEESGVRTLAATNRDLAQLKERGLFREDLYYRLNVLQLNLPPLRERPEDIEPITQHLLAWLAGPGATSPKLTADAIGALLLYHWPGNIRELENALKRGMLLSGPYGPIDLHHLPPEVSGRLELNEPRPTYRRYMKSAELLLIRWALSACQNDRTRSARFLGLSRAALYKKLKLYPEFSKDSQEVKTGW